MKSSLLLAIYLIGFPPLTSGGSGEVATEDGRAVPLNFSIASAVDPKTGDLVYTLTATQTPLVIANPKTKVSPTLTRLRLAGLEEHLKEPVIINGTVTIVIPVGDGRVEERRSEMNITVNDDLIFGGGTRIYAIKRN